MKDEERALWAALESHSRGGSKTALFALADWYERNELSPNADALAYALRWCAARDKRPAAYGDPPRYAWRKQGQQFRGSPVERALLPAEIQHFLYGTVEWGEEDARAVDANRRDGSAFPDLRRAYLGLGRVLLKLRKVSDLS